ncbi:hypothetical protein BCR43DRAFT_487503 [Syncephalastrum racemosum]|uniref:Uncharacterized protein n=1 Tax=Syncephalastrum racemosum TaxID=13706 RepID=A0A1X2HQX8_SYNRA|nr:hypothetical protein BCR43DRAFT_487503 [Syncephalastrum racemosum]
MNWPITTHLKATCAALSSTAANPSRLSSTILANAASKQPTRCSSWLVCLSMSSRKTLRHILKKPSNSFKRWDSTHKTKQIMTNY